MVCIYFTMGVVTLCLQSSFKVDCLAKQGGAGRAFNKVSFQ